MAYKYEYMYTRIYKSNYEKCDIFRKKAFEWQKFVSTLMWTTLQDRTLARCCSCKLLQPNGCIFNANRPKRKKEKKKHETKTQKF